MPAGSPMLLPAQVFQGLVVWHGVVKAGTLGPSNDSVYPWKEVENIL